MDFEFHPLCLALPAIDKATMDRRRADYEKYPKRAGDTAVVLAQDEADGKWKIADGRHHYLICKELGYEVEFQRFRGTPQELADLVAARGLDRRHMTQSQRAAAVAVMYKWVHGGDRKTIKASQDALIPTQEEMAGRQKVGRSTIQRAAKVAADAPELLPAVRDGKLDAKTAAAAAGLPPADRQKVAKAKKPKAEADRLLKAAGTDKPDHPFAGLLSDITRLAAAVTKAVKEESDEGKRLHAYMGLCGLLTHDEVGQKGATLIALRGVYAVVNAAGQGKVLGEKAIKAIYDKASGGWVPPLHARRKKAKNTPTKERLVDL